jgi:glutaredoxin
MKRSKKVVLYAISTCVWCNRTKRLLNSLGVEYEYVDVDLLSRSEESKVMAEVQRFNPDGGFPLLVINNKEIVKGFDEERIRSFFNG